MTKMKRLDELLQHDPRRAKVEILKHLEGDLMILPRRCGGPQSPKSTRLTFEADVL